MQDRKFAEKSDRPSGQECRLGLDEGCVAVMSEQHNRLMKAVFGDGNGNKGLMPWKITLEGQLRLLMWLFGPSSILGLFIAIATLIIELKHG